MEQLNKSSKSENVISVDQKLCRIVIVSLLYLTTSRLDSAFTVGICTRFQVNSK